MSSPLIDLSDQLAAIVERVGAATLAARGASALHWRDGLVVTTAHPFRHAPAALSLVGEGGRAHDAVLVGADPATDLAVYRLADASGLPAAELTAADSVRTGALAVAVGRSARGDTSGSFGMVHRAAGPWQTWLGGSIERRIELDGGLHDGESGAAVADASGRVFGIATPALSRRHAIVVPTGTVNRVVDTLLDKGHVSRAFLGIGAQPVALDDGAGLLVSALASGGPAARSGLMVGDIVTAVAGVATPTLAALRQALSGRSGAILEVALRRGGVPMQVTATVGEWPRAARRCG